MESATPPVVRPARPSDAEALGRLWTAVYITAGVATRANPYGVVDALKAIDNEQTFIAQLGTRLLGAVVLSRHGSRWASLTAGPAESQLSMLAVRADARGAGVGGALVDRCQDEALRQLRRALVLWTRPEMEVARGLYERRGFRRLPERDWAPDGLMRIAYGLDFA
jgi:ribosomal protein S18 acetylase RimI-like enzyme